MSSNGPGAVQAALLALCTRFAMSSAIWPLLSGASGSVTSISASSSSGKAASCPGVIVMTVRARKLVSTGISAQTTSDSRGPCTYGTSMTISGSRSERLPNSSCRVWIRALGTGGVSKSPIRSQ